MLQLRLQHVLIYLMMWKRKKKSTYKTFVQYKKSLLTGIYLVIPVLAGMILNL